MRWAAGLDIGGTNVKAVAVAADGTVLQRITSATADGIATPADWISAACTAIETFSNACESPPTAVGVCAPGLAAADERSIGHLPGKLAGLAGIDWTNALGQPQRVPVLNDGHAAMLGEAWIGAARTRRHVVMLTLGTGIGGAVLADGRLLRGAIGRAGHIGHMSLDPEGPVSITGMPGAVEVLFGDYTVSQRTSGRFRNTAALVAAHRSGDHDATRAWLKSIRALATAIGSCINLFDPEVVVIGGGIAQAEEALFDPLARELERLEWRPGGRRVPLVPAKLGDEAGGIGAAAYAMQAIST